ncbi:MAG: hypothetical protein HYX72_03850 [Acidobacteria bacterium]|nr:hypothetical protein [Acidobacteriota bacterium]
MATNRAWEPESTGPGQKLNETAAEMKERVQEMGRKAADKADEQRQRAASGLERAADTLHEKAATLPGGERVQTMAHATADNINAAADYIREHDFSALMKDVEDLVRRHPGPSLAAAVFAGFMVGRMFRSED